MIAGIVDHETGTRDIRKLGGLMSKVNNRLRPSIYDTKEMPSEGIHCNSDIACPPSIVVLRNPM